MSERDLLWVGQGGGRRGGSSVLLRVGRSQVMAVEEKAGFFFLFLTHVSKYFFA